MPINNPGEATGFEHLRLLTIFGNRLQKKSGTKLQRHSNDLMLLGTGLCALFQAATCYRKCHGGNHVLEYLAGRTYNLAAAAYDLIQCGYYDEALNLVRGIGEVGNLVLLSVVDKGKFQEWLSSDKRTRLRKFNPGNVRRLLEENGAEIPIIDYDWYSDLSERYTHVTPKTKPNMHNEARPVVGGIYQEDGQKKSLEELTYVTCFVALPICRYFQFDDLFESLSDGMSETTD